MAWSTLRLISLCLLHCLCMRMHTPWHYSLSSDRLQGCVRSMHPVLPLLISCIQVWAVTIGTAILQTQLSKRLPQAFIEEFPGGVAIAYSAIPVIPTLHEPLRSQIQAAFAESIRDIWLVMIGVSTLGLFSSLFMEGLPLHTQVDENWGLEKEPSSHLQLPTATK